MSSRLLPAALRCHMDVILLIILLAVGFASVGYLVGMTLDGYVVGRWQFRMPAILHRFWDWLHTPTRMGEVVQFPNQ